MSDYYDFLIGVDTDTVGGDLRFGIEGKIIDGTEKLDAKDLQIELMAGIDDLLVKLFDKKRPWWQVWR